MEKLLPIFSVGLVLRETKFVKAVRRAFDMGEIYTTYGVWFENCVSHTDETLLTSKKYFGYGDILFAITGESVEDIAKCCAYIGHETCLAGGDIVVLKHNEDPKYLSYALSTLDAQKQKEQGKS